MGEGTRTLERRSARGRRQTTMGDATTHDERGKVGEEKLKHDLQWHGSEAREPDFLPDYYLASHQGGAEKINQQKIVSHAGIETVDRWEYVTFSRGRMGILHVYLCDIMVV